MLEYILKSSACLAILLLFYRVFLENERMHTFKRFYLLGALILSLIIPLLVFMDYVTVPTQEKVNVLNAIEDQEMLKKQEAYAPPFDFTSLIWSIYYVGFMVFGLKFTQNLVQLIKRIRKNPKQKLERCTHVLTKEKMPPHTFLKFIFLNKQQLENDEIPNEVLVHEETHAVQKHSWDVIFIELLHLILWFNPLMVLFKRAIKLNHEFLADQAVLSQNIEASSYQNMLLAFSTANQGRQFHPVLSNAINYSSIKKRLTVMKTKTSKKSVLIRSLLLLPLCSLLLYGFSDKKTIPRISKPITVVSKDYHIKIKVNAKQEIFVNGKITQLEHLSTELNSILKSNDLNNLPSKVHLEAEGHLNIELLTAIKKQLSKTQATLTMIMADSIIISEKDLDETFKGTQFTAKDTFHIKLDDGEILTGISTPKTQEGASRKLMEEYNKLAKNYNDIPKNTMRVHLKDVNRLTYIYNLMSEKQRKHAEPFLNFPEPPQQSATREQMAEYNKLAKQYNNMSKNNMRVSLKDVNRLTYIYNLMSEKQRKDAEPFPNFPDLPPPPKAPSNKEIIEVVPPKPPKPAKDEFKEVSPQPPMPPKAPKSPVEHIKEIAKKGAVFYYEGNQISSEKAVDLVESNKHLNVDSRSNTKSGKPVVKISKNPIIIER